MKIEVLIENETPIVRTDNPQVVGWVDPSLTCEDVKALLRRGQKIPIMLQRSCQLENRRAAQAVRSRSMWKALNCSKITPLGFQKR